MPAPIKMTIGEKFNRLTVVALTEGLYGRRAWLCQCDCGNMATVEASRLLSGHIKSCGCYGVENRRYGAREALTIHGASGTRPYIAYVSMISRCENPCVKAFVNYGGRGIYVCARWRENYANFLADMGPRPAGMSIERIDNDGPYSRENCRWATRTEQANNTRHNKRVTAYGQTKNLNEWAAITSLTRKCISQRLDRGWAPEMAVWTGAYHG